ncbi:DSPTP1 [Symbiodinium microadriaticum]|nr:DSPTP1 [Symbiodinium microadriaticum]CAE7936686.1 DSPTP1 [Symbiodinium sp. KB8]
MASRAAPDCPETLAAAKRLLEDQMGTVRESAIKAIAALVPKGSREAIDWISPRLDDWHESVRRAAVVAVAKIAEKGDQHAIELEKSACDDRSWIVRKAATDSLAATATLNDLPSLRKLAKMLEDFDPLPRMAAIYGMAELCGVGHRKDQSLVPLGPAASLLKAIVAHLGRLLEDLIPIPKEPAPKPEILGNPFHDRGVQKHLRKLQRKALAVLSSEDSDAPGGIAQERQISISQPWRKELACVAVWAIALAEARLEHRDPGTRQMKRSPACKLHRSACYFAAMEPSNGKRPLPGFLEISEEAMERKLAMLRRLVAQPINGQDTCPSQVGEGLFVGNKRHATDVRTLVSLGVTGAMNCAPTGISSLNLDVYTHHGIAYGYTNVSQDDYSYPILHDRDGHRSEHLETAKSFYDRVRQTGGNVLFFCVAGQNRSATLAVAVQILQGKKLEEILTVCSKCRPFILENVGFQRQLVELEIIEERLRGREPSPQLRPLPDPPKGKRLKVETFPDSSHVEVELLVSGVCTMAAVIPVEATIDAVRHILNDRVNSYLTCEKQCIIGKSWMMFTMFGLPPEFDLVLEEAAVEVGVQIARLQSTFGLEIVKAGSDSLGASTIICWNSRCRFELAIFSVLKGDKEAHEPFTFRHEERPGAPGTLLAENFLDTNLRAWDFTSGEAFRSTHPIIFSYSDDPRSKRDFMNISTSKMERQQFDHPGEGGILGMGANAIVHRVELEAVEKDPEPVRRGLRLRRLSSDHSFERRWDAAVKRPFSLWKMLASMEHKSEAGVAKRLRMAGALNKQGRLLYFYGLGITLASNNNNHNEYKFEVTLLSQYQEDFSAYTLKMFMEDYTKVLASGDLSPEEHWRIKDMQSKFSLIKVKVLLVSLLNGFRDLTLMGVQAFDFNHMNNVLVSRDCRKARLIDIDGDSKGSIQFPSEYIQGSQTQDEPEDLHKPALDVDLSTMLPLVIQYLICGKGRGTTFVTNLISKVRRAKTEEDAKELIRQIVQEDFFPKLPACPAERECSEKHLAKVVEWFYALLIRRSPWTNWTNDIYDAMRCIDHLPIS